MMVINNNIPALTTYDVVNNTSNQLQKTIQKLSTGLRINSAADDAAGLSISEKMRAQINGLDQAVRNTQDGISLIQTAEGALTETHSILQRMRELSVQAANDTYTAQDRSYIQEEIDLLREEIDHIGNTTTFNTKKLLNGDAGAVWSSDNLNTKALIRGGLRTIDQFGQKSSAEGNYKIEITSTAGSGEVQKTNQFRIKHNVTENEWKSNYTDNVIITSATAEGFENLVEQPEGSFAVYIGTKDATNAFEHNGLITDGTAYTLNGNSVTADATDGLAATVSKINTNSPDLSFADTSVNTLNGLVKFTVDDSGNITANFWGNDKNGNAYEGATLVDVSTGVGNAPGASLTKANLSSATLGIATLDDDGKISSIDATLGTLTGGNTIAKGDHYYEVTAHGDADSDAGNGDVIVSVESSITGKTQQFVMSQDAFDDTDNTTDGAVKFVTHGVAMNSAGDDYLNIKSDLTTPEYATVTLNNSGSWDQDDVTIENTTNADQVASAEAIGYTTGLVKGDEITVDVSAATQSGGTMQAASGQTAFSSFTGSSGNGAGVNGKLTITATGDGTAITLTGSFVGFGRDGTAINVDNLTASQTLTSSTSTATFTIGGQTINIVAGTGFNANESGTVVYDLVAGADAGDKVISVTQGGTTTKAAVFATTAAIDGNTYEFVVPQSANGVSVTFASDTTTPITANDLATGTIATLEAKTGMTGAEENLATFELKEGTSTDTVGQIANSNTKLRDLEQFWDSQGNFMLEEPQTLTITQGDGQTAKVTLYKYDTVGDMTDKINTAIAETLGQAKYLDEDDGNYKVALKSFATFVSNDDNDTYEGKENTSEAVEGTMLIRSIVPGSTGTLSFASNNEEFINALGLNTIQSADDSTYTVTITDAHTGNTVVDNEKITGNVLVGKLHQNVDVEFDAMSGITATWSSSDKEFSVSGSTTATTTYLHLSDNTTVFQIGANEGDDMGINIGDMRSHALGLDNVLVTDHESASRSISIIDSAIDRVSTQRAKLGAYQNRLEHTAANLTTSAENLTASESRIRDTDMAKTMMDFTKLQIMLQAGNSMLAQANQLPQNVLSLIR